MNTVTLKPGLVITQGNQKLYHSIRPQWRVSPWYRRKGSQMLKWWG